MPLLDTCSWTGSGRGIKKRDLSESSGGSTSAGNDLIKRRERRKFSEGWGLVAGRVGTAKGVVFFFCRAGCSRMCVEDCRDQLAVVHTRCLSSEAFFQECLYWFK